MNSKYIFTICLSLLFVINISSQTYFNPDRYSTNHFDGWISCTPSNNPNTARGVSHWIMYDLGQKYTLGTSHIWNVNDPDNLTNGIQNMVIDYSEDGVLWTELGVYTMPQSNGSLYYNGVVGPNFNWEKLRFVLMTAIDNYGGSCYGFSELQVNVADQNLPLTLIDFSVDCNNNNINVKWKTEEEIGIEKYEIQGSNDIKEWLTIKTIKPIVDHETSNNYESGIIINDQLYYRLKSVNLDGTYTFSEIETTDCSSKSNLLSILPNPSLGVTQISFLGGNSGYEFSVYDTQGKLIFKEENNSENEEVNIDFSTEKLIPGAYYVNIKSNNQILVKKLIVL